MLVTEGTFPHVCQFDGPLRACVHEPVAALGMELCRCNDFCKFFHIRRFDINNIEALVLYVEVPEIDAKIIAADEGLAIAID